MKEARLMNILTAPVISEKSTGAQANNTVVFKVLPDATKLEIKAAVEKIFNVKVASVHTANMPGKSRRTVHGIGKRSDWKKAYVTLPEGTEIDFETVGSQDEKKESK